MKRWVRRVLGVVGCMLGLLASLAAAEEAPSAGLALAFEAAWQLNPQASALDAREAEARAAQEVAGGLTPEPGAISLSRRNDRLRSDLGREEQEVELSVPLWLPGQKQAREIEADSLLDEVRARRAALRLTLSGEVREAWWTFAAARNTKALAARRLETARALEADVLRRYQAGDLSRIDANLAQMETQVAMAEAIEADTASQEAEQALQTRTGGRAPEVLDQELPRAQEALTADGDALIAAHPLLVAAGAAARSARARVRVALESRRASPEIALRVIRERNDYAEPYSNTIGIAVKIPFSSGAGTRREVSAAEAQAIEAEVEWQRAKTRLRLDAERARANLEAAERQLVLAKERGRLAADNLHLSERAFALGETDLASLLRIRAAAFDADAFLDRQQVARAAAISRLNQALGVLP